MRPPRPKTELVSMGDALDQAMTPDQLLDEKLMLMQDTANIREQLEHSNNFKDPSWKGKASFALRKKQTDLDRIDAILAVKLDAKFTAAFVDAAREHLAPGDFAVVEEMAKNRV